jgi:serine/threonine-protein kinase
MTDEVVEGYVLKSRIGQGAMGTVYEAEHPGTGKRAAIKILSTELARFPGAVGRFKVEARAASSIKHQGVVEIFSFNVLADGRPYIIMELLEGETLAAYLGRLRPAEPVTAAARVGSEIASIVAAAHAHGVLHRDLKPQNVFLARGLEPGNVTLKILDFGLAKLINREVTTVLTQPGGILGTPAYMSPEQCRGRSDLDVRADVYSFACLLFELVAGHPPFVKEALGDFIIAHATEPPPTLASLGHKVPAPFEALVGRMLAKDRRIRPSDVGAIRLELDRFGAGDRRALVQTLYEGAVERGGSGRPSKATTVVMNRGEQTVDIRSGGDRLRRATTLSRAVVETETPRPPPRTRRRVQNAVATASLLAIVVVGLAAGSRLYDDGRRATAAATPAAPAHAAAAPVARPAPPPTAPPSAPAPTAAAPLPTPAAPAPAPAAPSAAAPAAPALVVTAPARVPPPQVHVTLTSSPLDSDVWVRGEPATHCRTPCTLSLVADDGSVTLVARKAGYFDRAKTIVPDRDQDLRFHLERQRAAAATRPPPSEPEAPSDEDPARL